MNTVLWVYSSYCNIAVYCKHNTMCVIVNKCDSIKLLDSMQPIWNIVVITIFSTFLNYFFVSLMDELSFFIIIDTVYVASSSKLLLLIMLDCLYTRFIKM